MKSVIQTAVRILIVFVVLMTFMQCKVNRGDQKEQKQNTTSSPAEKKNYRIGIIYFGPDVAAELCMKGLFDGLKELGFVEGQNLEVKKSHAQAEIANIPLLFQNFDSMGLDAIIPMTTPCLTAACTTVKKTPVVFTYVYDPIAAGAGKNASDHLPFVTGTRLLSPCGRHGCNDSKNSSCRKSCRHDLQSFRSKFCKSDGGRPRSFQKSRNQVGRSHNQWHGVTFFPQRRVLPPETFKRCG